jgi:hypothetical protein
MTRSRAVTVHAPHVPFPGASSDADFMRSAASHLEGGYEVGGSNLTRTVVTLLRDLSLALGTDADASTVADPIDVVVPSLESGDRATVLREQSDYIERSGHCAGEPERAFLVQTLRAVAARLDGPPPLAHTRLRLAHAIGAALYGEPVWHLWAKDPAMASTRVGPVLAAADAVLFDDLVHATARARFDERLADLRTEFARRAETWDRQRARLESELASARAARTTC